MNAISPIAVPLVVSNPDPPQCPLWRLINHRAAGLVMQAERAMDWLADDPRCHLTLLFRRCPGELRMTVDGSLLLLRAYPLPGEGALTWAEVCGVVGITDASLG